MSGAPTGRDNGLPSAASYVALVDVDPPVADHVLAVLRDAGVAALAEPLAGEAGPYRDVRPPTSPTERVYVDRERVDLAREVIAGSLPALRADFHADAARRTDAAVMRAAELDQIFATIVSRFDEPTVGLDPWPSREDHSTNPPDQLGDGAGTTFDPEKPADPGDLHHPAPPVRGSGLSSRLVRRGTPPQDEDPDPTYWPSDHYVPPVPPPLPRLDRLARFSWIGLIGGPLVLLLVVVLNLRVDRVVPFAAGAAFIAGFITLVARMPDRARDEDDWDDGAVV